LIVLGLFCGKCGHISELDFPLEAKSRSSCISDGVHRAEGSLLALAKRFCSQLEALSNFGRYGRTSFVGTPAKDNPLLIMAARCIA
jgi:hypothetical protein